eukprot:CAMPEP_0170111234 /NCGR_PEP_ID=MMETSP0020_2-20130122/8354_1 /TAXON_ID=98059 /ORGANISM="Dinobryon sp., Strain UTEXLB2267" /LENGTH=1300 /DNA_ID=CAMNT_0010336725 /DNA_START=1048 /DNA_END=4950 /DNA_ORIENTATION=-
MNNNWREIKKQIIAIRSILRSKEVSSDDKKRMERSIQELQSSMEFTDSAAFRDEILLRRDFLSKNPGLLDIFNTFWFISTAYVGQDGTLSKDGYLKIMYSFQVALCGFKSFDDMMESLDFDYQFDLKLFGPLTRASFYDLLFEVIETWSEIIDKNYLAAFSWALLDSVVDINAIPPRLKYIRDVECIMKISNVSEMISKHFTNKKIRSSLTIKNEFMQRISEVQKRLRSRKLANQISDHSLNMIDMLHSRGGSSSHMFSDSEDEISVARSQHAKLPRLSQFDILEAPADGSVNTTRELVKPITGMSTERSDAMIVIPPSLENKPLLTHRNSNNISLPPVDDEDDKSHTSEAHSLCDDNISVNSSLSRQSSSVRNAMRQRFNTMSFLEYLKARRNARQVLNGDVSVAGSSASHSRCGVLSTYSMDVDMLPLSPLQEVQKGGSQHSSQSQHSHHQQTAHNSPQQKDQQSIKQHQKDDLVSILPSVQSENPVAFNDSLFSGNHNVEEATKLTQPITARGSSSQTSTAETLDIVGNRLATLKSSQKSATDGKNKKSAFPMKNVLIDVMTINNGLNIQQQKQITKPKFDPNSSVRNGFNSEMGMTVKSISVSIVGGNGNATKNPATYQYQETPPSTGIMNVNPISEASMALAALKNIRQKTESLTVTAIVDKDQKMSSKSGSSESTVLSSRLYNDLLMTQDFNRHNDDVSATGNSRKSDLQIVFPLKGMIITDEDFQTPLDQSVHDHSKFQLNMQTEVDGDSITRTIHTDGSEQNSVTNSPMHSQRATSPRLMSATIIRTNEERALSPPKTAALTPYRNILGPYPSSYFLSDEENVNDAQNSQDNFSGDQLSRLDGNQNSVSIDGRRKSYSSVFTDSSNRDRVNATITDKESPNKDDTNDMEKQTHVHIPTSLQTGDANTTILHVITNSNSRGIFKGLALGDRSHPAVDRKSGSSPCHINTTNTNSFVNLDSNLNHVKDISDELLQKSQSYNSLPATAYFSGRRNDQKLYTSSKDGQSMPSLLIKPVTSVRKPGKQSAKRGLINKAAVDGDTSPGQQSFQQGQVSVIDSSVKSLTMLSASEFAHLKNSIELSVGGVNHQNLNHIHPYNVTDNNNGHTNASSTQYSAKRHPQMTLQSVGQSPVKYECHQSFLNISGSRDHNSNYGVNNRSVFSSTASNALNSAALQFENTGYTPAASHYISEVNESTFNNNSNQLHPMSQSSAHHPSPFYPKVEFSHAPWMPAELALPADHHRSNRILGWKEKLETLKNFPIVPAKAVMTIKSQDAVRVSFEEFVRASPKKMGRLP